MKRILFLPLLLLSLAGCRRDVQVDLCPYSGEGNEDAYVRELEETQVLVDVRPFSVVLTPECRLSESDCQEPLTVRLLSPRDTLFVRLDPHGGPQRFRF